MKKQVEKLEAKKLRTQKRALPSREECARRGQWLLDTTESICGSCSERTDDGSSVIMRDLFACSDGTYALHCKRSQLYCLPEPMTKTSRTPKTRAVKLPRFAKPEPMTLKRRLEKLEARKPLPQLEDVIGINGEFFMRVFNSVCVDSPDRLKCPHCPRVDCETLFKARQVEAKTLAVNDPRVRVMLGGVDN